MLGLVRLVQRRLGYVWLDQIRLFYLFIYSCFTNYFCCLDVYLHYHAVYYIIIYSKCALFHTISIIGQVKIRQVTLGWVTFFSFGCVGFTQNNYTICYIFIYYYIRDLFVISCSAICVVITSRRSNILHFDIHNYKITRYITTVTYVTLGFYQKSYAQGQQTQFTCLRHCFLFLLSCIPLHKIKENDKLYITKRGRNCLS